MITLHHSFSVIRQLNTERCALIWFGMYCNVAMVQLDYFLGKRNHIGRFETIFLITN